MTMSVKEQLALIRKQLEDLAVKKPNRGWILWADIMKILDEIEASINK